MYLAYLIWYGTDECRYGTEWDKDRLNDNNFYYPLWSKSLTYYHYSMVSRQDDVKIRQI